jgi:hypothetical protein
MNGDLMRRSNQGFATAAARVALLCPTNEAAVEAAYLIVLTRKPSPEESKWFTDRLAGAAGAARLEAVEDLVWTLANSAEFAWNH